MGSSGDSEPTPKNLRTILLAYPKRCTKKYVPPVYVPGYVDTGVPPSAVSMPPPPENWRINQLAQRPAFKTRPKWVFVPPKGVGSGVPRSALNIVPTKRLTNMALPTTRYLKNNRLAFKFLGSPFVPKMLKFYDQSWNSTYNFYKRQKYEQKLKRIARRKVLKEERMLAKLMQGKGKGAKIVKLPTPKEIRAQKMKEFEEWVKTRALPKKVFPPRKPRKRKVVDLFDIATHMNAMAEPRFRTKKYIRPSIDPTYKDPYAVKDSAKKYITSDRMKELSQNPAYKMVKEPIIKPGAVKRSALRCKVSPRFGELAVPKRKAAEKESDEKENPFAINPWALKAKPSPRTIELSKPIER